MKTLVVLALFGFIASSFALTLEFKEYMQKYNKEYLPSEIQTRFQLFEVKFSSRMSAHIKKGIQSSDCRTSSPIGKKRLEY
jgi:hypothetical protein